MVLTRLAVVTVLAVLVVMMAGHARGETQDFVAMQALRAKLLEGYDKHTMPMIDHAPVHINMSGFSIRNIYMDERRHQVHLHAWPHFTWVDSRFMWNPEEHGDLSKLSIEPSDVWIPDLTVYNAGDAASTPLAVSKARVILYPNGNVLQVPPLDLVYDCVVDLTYWPHDVHHCKLKIGSWVHDGYTIDFLLSDDLETKLEATKMMPEVVGVEDVGDTMEWKVDSSSMTRVEKFYDCCSDPYVSVETTLKLRRVAPAYTWLIKIPAVCFSLLTLVIFLLPPDAGEKITFGAVCLLLHLVFLVFASDTVKSAPIYTPLIVQLVVVELVLVAASVVVAAIVVRVARTPNTSQPPSSLTSLARSLSPFLLLSGYAKEASGPEGGSAKTDEVELANKDGSDKAEKQRVAGAQWMLVGAFVDRLSLIVCLVVIIIVLARFSMVI